VQAIAQLLRSQQWPTDPQRSLASLYTTNPLDQALFANLLVERRSPIIVIPKPSAEVFGSPDAGPVGLESADFWCGSASSKDDHLEGV
jgi:hypothetical protein